MKITIDFDSATAKCSITGIMPTASNPNLNPNKIYNFNELDTVNQLHALAAFHCIESHWNREHKIKINWND